MPPLETEALKKLIGSANSILEYGSGGSTALAASLNKKIVTVETDRKYLDELLDFCDSPNITGIHVNVGPTKHWGYAVNIEKNFSGINKYAIPP